MDTVQEKETEKTVYYFRCEGCGSDVFWSDVRPSVERAARVFKWVRAGCPHGDCSAYLILSAPDKIYHREEAQKIYDQKKAEGEKAYWI